MSTLQRTNPNRDTAPSLNSLRRSNDILTPVVGAPDKRGRALMKAVVQAGSVSDILNEVNALWVDAQQSFLSIGQYLLQARDIITRKIVEKEPGLEGRHLARAIAADYRSGVLDHLPFGRTVAVQLESVARAFYVEGRIKAEEMPHSYATAYVLVRMTDEELDAARREGALKPEVERRTLLAYRKASVTPTTTAKEELLLERRTRLLAKQAELRQELDAVEMELSKYRNGR